MHDYYTDSHANVHRGAYALAKKATDLYETSREKVQRFINASRREEIIFTRGATEAINIVALSWTQRLQPGDEIILTVMEHHSNLVPWQLVAQRTGAVLKFVQLTPIKQIVEDAHKVGARVLVDACQSAPHFKLDVQDLGMDFMACSGHKMCGPTGIGFLYGRYEELLTMPPAFGGGEMVIEVQLESSTYALPPSRFEAGTPPIAAAIGLGAACNYLNEIGLDRIHAHECALGSYLYSELEKIPDLTLYGPPASTGRRSGLVAFNSNKVCGKLLAQELDKKGIAVRAGSFCTQPLHRSLGIPHSLRASVYFYNSKHEVDVFISELKEAIHLLNGMSSAAAQASLHQ